MLECVLDILQAQDDGVLQVIGDVLGRSDFLDQLPHLRSQLLDPGFVWHDSIRRRRM
jgi:hypothetical protein